MSDLQLKVTFTLASRRSLPTIALPSMSATAVRSLTSVVLLTANRKWLTLSSARPRKKILCAKIASSRRSVLVKHLVRNTAAFRSTGNASTVVPLLSSAASVHTTCANLAMMSTTVPAIHLYTTATASTALLVSPILLPTQTHERVESFLLDAASVVLKRWRFSRTMPLDRLSLQIIFQRLSS